MRKSAIPNLFTISNLACGFVSIHYAANGKLVAAAWLIVIAAFLDAFDGKLARLLDAEADNGEFGLQFDSLADVCSFGVAPGVLMLHYFDPLVNLTWLPLIAAFLFLLSGAYRLARFNTRHAEEAEAEVQVDEDEPEMKPDFVGLPIPVAATTLCSFVIFSQRVWESTREPHVGLSLCVLLAILMISPFDYPAFPRFTFETVRDRFRIALSLGAMVVIFSNTEAAFFPVSLAFCLSGAIRWLVHQVTDREVVDLR
jgi:CDP-diacylglycerol--serine O-phosphatidyltransferase